MRLFVRSTAKHAKPSAAPQVAVAGGLTAAVLLGDGASAASASAPNSQWDKLAQCESGGNWSINTGNGYYGGLQFNLATWRGAGGSGRPDRASRTEQIRVANRLHDVRGFSPWPSCSRKLNLRSGPASAAEPKAATADRSRERASRARRTAPVAAPKLATYQASARVRVVVALATTTPPRFDGKVMSARTDAGTYRLATKHWQRRMAARGWDIAVDGKFGAQSARIAQRFAAQKGLTPAVPGTVDLRVWNAAWALPVS